MAKEDVIERSYPQVGKPSRGSLDPEESVGRAVSRGSQWRVRIIPSAIIYSFSNY